MSWQYYGDPRPDVQRLVSPAGRAVLDVGCGEGALAAALKEQGASYVAGIEMKSSALEHARRVVDDLVEGDAGEVELPFASEQFDYLIFADVLEHLPQPERVLRRMLPLLKPDGRVVVSVPNSRFYLVLARLLVDRWEYADHGVRDRTHLRLFTRRSLLAMLTEEGLVVDHLTRNQRLIEDQTEIGRVGAIATHIARQTLGRVFRDLLTYQYVVVASRRAQPL